MIQVHIINKAMCFLCRERKWGLKHYQCYHYYRYNSLKIFLQNQEMQVLYLQLLGPDEWHLFTSIYEPNLPVPAKNLGSVFQYMDDSLGIAEFLHLVESCADQFATYALRLICWVHWEKTELSLFWVVFVRLNLQCANDNVNIAAAIECIQKCSRSTGCLDRLVHVLYGHSLSTDNMLLSCPTAWNLNVSVYCNHPLFEAVLPCDLYAAFMTALAVLLCLRSSSDTGRT